MAEKRGAAAVVVGNKAAPEGTAGGYQIVGEETVSSYLSAKMRVTKHSEMAKIFFINRLFLTSQ